MNNVRVSPRARADLRDALRWYRDRDPSIGHRFLMAINACVDRLASAPHRWPMHSHGARRLLVPRFPYAIYYRELGDEVMVIAIAHTSRHPDAWRAPSDKRPRED